MRQRIGRWKQTDRYIGSYFSQADGQADKFTTRPNNRLKEKYCADGQAKKKKQMQFTSTTPQTTA